MQRFLLSAGLALAFTCTLFSQTTTLRGFVGDVDKNPLVGATIAISGATTGTITDESGSFEISIVPDQVLVITSLGYETRRISFTNEELQSINEITKGITVFLRPISTVLDEITVTATNATSKIPVTYTNLEKPEIQERNLGQDAPYILKWTPSVVVNSDAGTGIGYTGIWIRGSDPTRTNVTINGIPYNDSESQGVFWVNLPDFSSSADQIQIQRGVGTSVNGAGAFGASINFNTNQIGEERKLSLDGSLGSFGTRRGSVQYTSGLLDNGLKVDARYSQTYSDGYIDRASADLRGYYAGLTYAPEGKNSVWRFNAFGGQEVTYQSWNGVTQDEIDEFGRTYNSVGTEKEGEPYDNEVDNYGQRHFQLHYNTTFGKATLGVSGHYTRGRGYFEQYKADEDVADYGFTAASETTDLIRRRWLDNDFYGTVYSLRLRATDDLDLTFGGSANEYLGDHFGEVIWARDAGDSEIRDRYYENDATKRDFSNYLRANYGFGSGFNAYADLQLRTVNYEFEGIDNNANFIDQDETLTFFNPKVGLLYDFGGGQAYASFGVAQREPNRNDFVDNPVETRPVPEKLYNTEVGVRKQTGRFNYGANVYYMDYRDQLVVTGEINDVGELVRTNVPESYRLGLELQGGYQLGNLMVGGNLTLSRNRVKAFTELLDEFDENFEYLTTNPLEQEDTPLAFSPSVTGALDLEYQVLASERHRFTAALQGKYVGERYVDNSGFEQSVLDAFYYADLRLAYRFAPVGSTLGAVRLTVLVRNVTDQLYVSNGWSYRFRFDGAESTLKGMYPQAGRNLLVGLGVDF